MSSWFHFFVSVKAKNRCFLFYVADSKSQTIYIEDFNFVCFGALRPKSTTMVMAGRSVHLTALFSWASLNKQLTSTSCNYF